MFDAFDRGRKAAYGHPGGLHARHFRNDVVLRNLSALAPSPCLRPAVRFSGGFNS